MASEKRTRNFATIIYEDSAPKNFKEIIESWHIPCFLSPYHDKDFNADGTPKKSHWHLLLMFENVKTAQQAIELFSQINGVGCEIVADRRGMARYLCHMDNPEKYRYPEMEVKAFAGADYFDVIASCSDQIAALMDIEDLVESRGIFTYSELCRILRNEYPSLYRIMVLGHTIHMTNFVKSFHYEERMKYENESKS